MLRYVAGGHPSKLFSLQNPYVVLSNIMFIRWWELISSLCGIEAEMFFLYFVDLRATLMIRIFPVRPVEWLSLSDWIKSEFFGKEEEEASHLFLIWNTTICIFKRINIYVSTYLDRNSNLFVYNEKCWLVLIINGRH